MAQGSTALRPVGHQVAYLRKRIDAGDTADAICHAVHDGEGPAWVQHHQLHCGHQDRVFSCRHASADGWEQRHDGQQHLCFGAD